MLAHFQAGDDVVSGAADAAAGRLTLRPTEQEKRVNVQIPIWPRGAYQLDGSFEMKNPLEDPRVAVILHCGRRRCRFDLWAGGYSAISQIDGEGAVQPDNPTRTKSWNLEPETVVPFSVRVIPDGDQVQISGTIGERQLSWSGRIDQLSLNREAETPLQCTLGLVTHNVEATFHGLTLTLLDSDAWLLRE